MLKKRVIFTLLYEDGYFVLSRNFRRQRVGNIEWLRKNYNFFEVSLGLDELLLLDISRGNRDNAAFSSVLSDIASECFIPISAGGGILCSEDARDLFLAGADKVVVNTSLFRYPEKVMEMVSIYGSQAVVASIDAFQTEQDYDIKIKNGDIVVGKLSCDAINKVLGLGVGELYLNSIGSDGTGQGLDFHVLDFLPENISIPIIMTGGIGKPSHLLEGLQNSKLDAVSTSNLFNFIGRGLVNARDYLIENGIDLPRWDTKMIDSLRGTLRRKN